MKKQKFILTAQRLIYIILTLSVATMLILLPNVVLSEETITWELYAREMRMQEEASGFYVDWNITDKEALIEVLIQMGALRETAATRRLLEEDFSVESRHALADQIMLQLLGGEQQPIGAQRWCSCREMEYLLNSNYGRSKRVDIRGKSLVSAT